MTKFGVSRMIWSLAVALSLVAQLTEAANPTQGGSVFDEECSDCHSLKAGKNKKGPSLFAVVGRPAGNIADYSYSDALKASSITWTKDRLDQYLQAPKKLVPGGKMKFDGLPNAQSRADLIAFLDSLH